MQKASARPSTAPFIGGPSVSRCKRCIGIPVLLALSAVLAVGFGGCRHHGHEGRRGAASKKLQNPAAVTTEAAATASDATATDKPSVGEKILAWLEANRVPRSKELIDVLPDETFRFDVVQEPNSPTWGKARLDLDRDGKFDEKWTLGGDGSRPAKRRVSTHDDGHYDREDRWRDGRWVRRHGTWGSVASPRPAGSSQREERDAE